MNKFEWYASEGYNKSVDNASQLESITTKLQTLNRKEFGVAFSAFSYNSSPAGRRLGDAIGMVANPSTDTVRGINDFDKYFASTAVNGYVGADGEFAETAVDGEPSFKRDGTNGDVWSRFSLKYFKYVFNSHETEMWITDYPLTGYSPFGAFIKPDGSLRNYTYIASYHAATGADGKYSSISGKNPLYNISHNSQLSAIRDKGSQYCGMTSKDVAFLQFMFCVEFATKDSQSIMKGCTEMNFQRAVTVAETGVQRVIVSNTYAANFPVGCAISIGTVNGDRGIGTSYDIVNRKKVISQAAYDASNTILNIDNGGATFNTLTSYTVSTYPWYTGATDSVLGQSGSPISNTSGLYPMKYRGVENLYGNMYTLMSDVMINDRKAYICYDCTKFSTAITSDYAAASYVNGNANGYISELGYDASHPSIRFPTVAAAGSTTGHCDYYWQDAGLRECLFGGPLHHGSHAGVFNWTLHYAVSNGRWHIAARLSSTGRCGAAAA